MSRGAGLPDPSETLEALAPEGAFDLAMTLHSGQAFGWHPVAGGHAGVVSGTALFLRQEKPGGPVLATKTAAALARHYLALDHDLAAIHATFPDTPRMREALSFCRGLRILRQPLWECLVSFIASSQKQVAHIRQIHRHLCERFGRPAGCCGGVVLYEFPGPERIAALDEPALRGCGLGYRAKHLLETARRVAGGALDLSALESLPTPEARDALMSLPGVGRKIANCVLCFALGRLGEVPVDVWVARILRESFTRRKMSLPQLERYASKRLGPFAGYAQQVLFHHARITARLARGGQRGREPRKTLAQS